MKVKSKLLISIVMLIIISIIFSFGIFAEGWEDDLTDGNTKYTHSAIDEDIPNDYYIIDDETLLFDGEYYQMVDSNKITVLLNGQTVDFTDDNGEVVEPQIINDRTMVPMRKIFEALGAEVNWNSDDRSVVAIKDQTEITLQIDNTTASITKDGQKQEITLDSAPVIVEGRTLVPVRFIAESLNKNVDWDGDNKTVIITDLEENVDYYEFYPSDEEDLSETFYYWIDGDAN